MKKIIFFILLSSFAAILSGCRNFYTVSLSKKAEGGIYCTEKSTKQVLSYPTMNYLISGSRYYYATAGRMPGKKSKSGAIAVLGRVHIPHCTLGVLQSVSAGGITPCHLTLSSDENFLYTANYSSGDISEFRLDNGKITGSQRLIKHEGKSITKRQKSPHPHFVGFSPDGKQLFASDLGTDKIFIYNYVLFFLFNYEVKRKKSTKRKKKHVLFLRPSGVLIEWLCSATLNLFSLANKRNKRKYN